MKGPRGTHGIARELIDSLDPMTAYILGFRIGAYSVVNAAQSGQRDLVVLDGERRLMMGLGGVEQIIKP